MSTIYRLQRPAPAVTSLQFDTYNEAVAYALGNPGLLPTKPYKRILWNAGVPSPTWFVSFGVAFNHAPTYEKIFA
jgi:hypothetical protein